MNYKEVLENQIKKLEEVQEQVLKGIIEREENAAYTERTLHSVMNASSKIESLVNSINRLNKTTKECNNDVSDKKEVEQELRVQVQPVGNVEFIDKIAKSITKNIIDYATRDTL